MAVSVSVRWLTEQRPLALVVLAGAPALDRRIEWAHSIELADPTPWLRGGELLLTTGLRLPPADETEQRGYVERLDAAGVAALGFGVGLSHPHVPPAVVAAAEAAGLPLLQVPLPTPFIAVIRAVTERIAEQQYEGVTRASQVQPRMTRAALQGGSRAVVRELATATGGSVLLLGDDGAVTAAHPAGARDLTRRVIEVLRVAAGATTCVGSSNGIASIASAGPGGVVTAQRLRVGRRAHGHLALVTAQAPTPVDHLLLGHAVSLIALDAEKPLRLRETQNRFNEMLVGLLLEDKLSPRQTAEQLRIAGLSVQDGVVALGLGGPGPRSALAALDRALLEHDLPCVGAVGDSHALVLLPAEPTGLAPDLLDAVARSRHPGRVPGGIARASGPDDVAGALRRCVTAARVALLQDVACVDAESMAGHVLVAAPAARAVLAELAEARLRPLADHDLQTDANLIATLRAFLEHHGHWEAASAVLGIHRHTLRNRIDRIQTLIGVDLESAHVRAELLLSLVVWSG